MFFDAYVQWPGCLPDVAVTTVTADVVYHTFGLLLFCAVFPAVCFDESFERCGCCEVGIDAYLLLE